MKNLGPLALALLALAPFAPGARQEGEEQQEKEQETPRKKERLNPVTSFFEDEAARITKELEGSWMLMEYVDPDEIPLEDAAQGFMTFHDGFLTWILAVEAFEQRFFSVSNHVFLQTGAYRYRIDERASLQLASVLGYTNDSESGELEPDPALAFEYTVLLQDGLLELRDPDGVRMTYRKVESGEFPDSAIRKIERQRSRTPAMQDEER